MNLSSFRSLIFDCDGVVLNSNSIKTEAFRSAALPWGSVAADALVAHHVANGGISRHRKFAHFLKIILPQQHPVAVPGVDGPGLDELLSSYVQNVRGGLMTCEVASRLEDLRSQTPNASWCIVSGGDQNELREVFALRGLDHLFDGGIFGSPDCKDTILARELTIGTIRKPALFLGDSQYDFQVAQRAGLDFIFVSGWTEVANWETSVNQSKIGTIDGLADLLCYGNGFC